MPHVLLSSYPHTNQQRKHDVKCCCTAVECVLRAERNFIGPEREKEGAHEPVQTRYIRGSAFRSVQRSHGAQIPTRQVSFAESVEIKGCQR